MFDVFNGVLKNMNKSVTYIVPIHNAISYDKHLEIVNKYDVLKNIDYRYVCSVNPEKTDINNIKYPNIMNIYDKNSIYSINNKILRFKSTIMYFLEHKNLIETDYVCIEGCTTYRLNRSKFQLINDDTLYTSIRLSNCFFNRHTEYNYSVMNNYYMKYFNYNSNIIVPYFLFDYCVFSMKISNVIYDFLKYYIDIVIKNLPSTGIWVSEFFDCCLYYNYINSDWKNKFKVNDLYLDYNNVDPSGKIKGMHFYGG